MLRIRTAALSLVAAVVSALTLGLAAGTAVAHDRGHFGTHRGHALAGMVQSVDPSTNTAVVTLGGVDRRMRTDWGHDSSGSSARQVTLNLSGAAIYDATAVHRHCSSPNHTANNSATTSTLSAVKPGDMATAILAVNHATANQDVTSGTAVPVSKLVDWGTPKAGSGSHHQHNNDGSQIRRFTRR